MIIFKKILKYIKEPWRIIVFLNAYKIGRIFSDRFVITCQYRTRVGKRVNLKSPKTFNEKLQWLKLHNRKPIYTTMVDKYEVKRFVAEQIGEAYIIPTLGVWERFEDIDFSKLPDQFVLKCTHDSGGLVICKNKAELDIGAAEKKIKQCLKRNYFYYSREWPYKGVKPRIIAEQYMVDDSGYELKDYKVLCFSGEPELIQIHRGRFGDHTQDFYDINWDKLDITQGLPLSDVTLEKPVFLEEMLSLSRALSAGIPHLRVDWYYVDSQLYFGELTFFDASGFDLFEPDEVNEKLGNLIHID